MITKKEILKMVKHVTKRGRNIPDRKLISPRREWAIGLIVAFLLIIVGLVLSAQRFQYYSSIEQYLTDSDSGVVEYKRGTMSEVLQRYDERTLKFQQIRNGIVPKKTQQIVVENELATTTENGEEGVDDMPEVVSDEILESNELDIITEDEVEEGAGGGLDAE